MPMDADKYQNLERMRALVDDWQESTWEGRWDSYRLRQYYHGDQWTEAQRQELRSRGQPEVVINFVADEIDYVIGTHEANKMDPHAYPRTQMHEDDAALATDSLRYVTERENYESTRSDLCFDLATTGLCGALVEPVASHMMVRGEQRLVTEICLRHVAWDRLMWDQHSRRQDFTDAFWLGLLSWRDIDELQNDPDYQGMTEVIDQTIASAAVTDFDELTEDRPLEWSGGVWVDKERNRIQVAELYYNMPELLNGEYMDVWWTCQFIAGGFLVQPRRVELMGDRGKSYCPLLMQSDLVTDDGVRYSRFRRLMSPQDEVNQRRSRALHLLGQGGAYFERGALADPEGARREMKKPDMMLELADEALRDGTFQPRDNTQLATAQFQLMQEAKADIDRIGPHSGILQQMGQEGRESGRLFIARQEDAGRKTRPFMAGLREMDVKVYNAIWRMIRQFWGEERWLRVTDDKQLKGYRFVAINRDITRGQRLQELLQQGAGMKPAVELAFGELANDVAMAARIIVQQEVAMAQQRGAQLQRQQVDELFLRAILSQPQANELTKMNQVAQLDVDIVIDESPASVIVQHEEFRELVNLATSGIVPIPPKAIIKASSLRSKNDILAELEPKQPNQAQQQQMALQLQMLQAQVAKLMSDVDLGKARAMKTMAEAQGVQYEAQKDQAQAAKYAAEAASEAADIAPPTVEIYAVPTATQGTMMPGGEER